MNRVIRITLTVALAISVLGVGVVTGFFIEKRVSGKSLADLSIKIIGDVEEPGSIELDKKGLETIKTDDGRFTSVRLSNLLARAVPSGERYQIYFIGDDGRTASITDEDISSSYLIKTDKGSLDAKNPKHPVSTNIKDVKEILVVSKDEDLSAGFNVISPDENIHNITPGEAYLSRKTSFEFGGASVMEEGQAINKGWVYEEKTILDLEGLIGFVPEGPYIFMGREGGYAFTYEIGSIEIAGNSFRLDGEGIEPIEDLAGMLIDPPSSSIMDVYYDTLEYTADGQNVMVVLVDGFSFMQFEKALDSGLITFTDQSEFQERAVSVYKPITNSGLAAMITGQPPYINGIYSRDFRELEVPDIFEVLKSRGKSSVLIEGDIGIIDTSIEPVLNTDTDNDGSKDDQIFESALKLIEDGYDMMFVHFHGLDDRGHDYGDTDPETLGYIEIIDGYINDLASRWEGKIIITADHGMHNTGESGSHGEFRFEDLIVPYIVIEGK